MNLTNSNRIEAPVQTEEAKPISTEAVQLEADKAVHLIFQNKINAKNAFDIDTAFFQGLGKILDG